VQLSGTLSWEEAMQYATSGIQGICPSGWHIPTLGEFKTLTVLINKDGNSLKRNRAGT